MCDVMRRRYRKVLKMSEGFDICRRIVELIDNATLLSFLLTLVKIRFINWIGPLRRPVRLWHLECFSYNKHGEWQHDHCGS